MTENPRGYLFVTMHKSYEQWQSWDWGAMAKQIGVMPTEWDVIDQALALWDSAMLDDPTQDYKLLTQSIRDYIGESIRTDALGAWGADRKGNKYLKYEYIPAWDEDHHQLADEQGYKDVEDMDELRSKLKLVRPRLTNEQFDILLLYVSGEAESMREAATMYGLDQTGYDRVRRQIRYAVKGLEL